MLDGGALSQATTISAGRRSVGARLGARPVLKDLPDHRRVEDARDEFRKAIELAPQFSPAHAALAKVNLALGDAEAATRHAELSRRPSRVAPLPDPLWQAVQLMSAATAGYFARAEFYIAQGQLDRGLAEMEKAVDGDQHDPGVWLFYASVMFDQGQHERVVVALDRVRELRRAGRTLAPHKFVSGLVLLAASHSRAGDPRSAERALLEALELDPASRGAARELARLYRAEGRTEEARELLERFSSTD